MTAIRSATLLIAAILLGVSFPASLVFGAAEIPLDVIIDAMLRFDSSNADHLVLYDFRFPRAVAALMVGASLAVAGAIMQGMTRNPLASPSLMGLNAGSGLALVIGLVFFPSIGFTGLVMLSFLGAFLGVTLVYAIGASHTGGLGPVRLALAGAAVSALLGAVTSIIVIYMAAAQDVLFYTAGGLQGVRWPQLALVLPWLAAGLVGAMVLSRAVTLLSLGNDVAAGLGANIWLARIGGVIVTLLLAGSSVALAGGIGFVGLVVPHIVRMLLGPDYRWVIPGAALFGAILLVNADLAARMLNPPYETPVGLITALIGVPFFLWLARRY
ncbi:FecCD family ABC transporter permease [Aquamicrobium segne]|uniref:FecCD family ABC transporter permease n=1 Tax=Aquamicrobium segne TaxID=469547 RepID=A0ABW0GYN3_9HYPH